MVVAERDESSFGKKKRREKLMQYDIVYYRDEWTENGSPIIPTVSGEYLDANDA